ncbi:MAG TPA: DUF3426 domain-containing protein [Steroidobacteraceae bacterium]|nr:DUF3426 domain-containing protein [Steroidobacteraceae bacterium]
MSLMVTTCANCRQQLAVTATDLRIGQGFVRCGRCDKVFNALLTLSEGPADNRPEDAAHGTMSIPALDEQEPLPPLPGREAEDDPAFDPFEEVEVVGTHVTGQYRSLVLEGEQIRPDQLALQEPPAPAANDAADGAAADTPDDEVARDIIRQATSQPIDILLDDAAREPPAPMPVISSPPDDVPVEGEFDADEALGNPPRISRLWHVAAALLLLLLAGQYAHHNRHALVAVPWLERPLQQVYALIGMTVEPAWNLDNYEMGQLGGMESSGDARTLVLRAAVAVRKEAPRGQPPPLLRAVLSDRWGNVLARHELAPGDWLLGDAPALIAPGQRLDAQLSMPAPAGVAGFTVHPCLPDSTGSLHCTDDARP